MRRLVLPLLACCVGLAACARPEVAVRNPGEPVPSPSGAATPSVSLPPAPEPTRDGPCPYLESDFVAQANGQRVSKVRASADAPHPACFFYALDGRLQLTVRVYVGEPAVATAVVDQAAPVRTSNPADEPAGWRGGYQTVEGGAVYAVARSGSAVVVSTNQRQTIKARTVAKRAVARLGL
jgi:hypothetical protein